MGVYRVLMALLSVFFTVVLFADTVFADGLTPAQAASLTELTLEELMNVTVVTASHTSEKASAAAATMRVVTRRQIQERGYRNLEDLIRDIPGFNIQNHQSPSDNEVAVRGVTGNNKILVLMDGVRVSAATNSDAVPIRDNYPLYNAKQVEVLYGPASALYGTDAMSGVINIITRDGADVDGLNLVVEGGGSSTTNGWNCSAEKGFPTMCPLAWAVIIWTRRTRIFPRVSPNTT